MQVKRNNILETGDIIYTINYYCYVEVHEVNKEKQTFNGYCLNISDQEKNYDINAGFIELTFDDIEKHFKLVK
jgi:hypothetical protein